MPIVKALIRQTQIIPSNNSSGGGKDKKNLFIRWATCNEMLEITTEFIQQNAPKRRIILVDSKFANPDANWNVKPYSDMLNLYS